MLDVILSIICGSIIIWYLPPVTRWRDHRAQARWEATHAPLPPRRYIPLPIPQIASYEISNNLGQSFLVSYPEPEPITTPMATTLIELRDTQGQRCGYARLGWLRPERLVISMIEVDEAYRGQGLGTAMLARIIHLAREQGVQTIEGSIPWERRPWYERNGFGWHLQRGMIYDLTGGSILYPRTGEPWTEEEDSLVRILGRRNWYSLIHRAGELQRHPDEFAQRLRELGIEQPTHDME